MRQHAPSPSLCSPNTLLLHFPTLVLLTLIVLVSSRLPPPLSRFSFCLLRGFKLIYARALACWTMYVLLGIGAEEEAAAKAAEEARLAAIEAALFEQEEEEEGEEGRGEDASGRKLGRAISPASAEVEAASAAGLRVSRQRRTSNSSNVSSSRASTRAATPAQLAMAPRQAYSRTYGAYLRQRHGLQAEVAAPSVAAAPGHSSPDLGLDATATEAADETEVAVAAAAAAEAAAAKAAAAPPRATTVVDIRVKMKLEIRRMRMRHLALRRSGGGGSGTSSPLLGGAAALADSENLDEEIVRMHHLDLQFLPGEQRTSEYTQRLAAKLAAMRSEFRLVSEHGERIHRNVVAQRKRREHEAKLLSTLEAEEDSALDGEQGRTAALLSKGTTTLESLLADRVAYLVKTYRKVAAEHALEYTWSVARKCMTALKEPLRWKRAVSIRNKWRLRRWLRICTRLIHIDRSIHRYHKVRTLRKSFLGWLYLTGDTIARMSPGLAPKLNLRRERVTLFARLLEAGKPDACPRCVFARWLEWTHLKVARRALVTCSRQRADSLLVRKVFDALHSVAAGKGEGAAVSSSGVGTRGVGGGESGGESGGAGDGEAESLARLYDERRWSCELERWVARVLRPETHSGWQRRKSLWLRRRALRLAREETFRLTLLGGFEMVKQRIAHEAELHFDDEARKVEEEGKMPEAYLTGALDLREKELRNLWSSCAAGEKRWRTLPQHAHAPLTTLPSRKPFVGCLVDHPEP